ncbi:MGH1-like glycoside hydrolase domain-containing protein [Kribbella solani]|uniref:MGH1-like glycoside hydrolase domain-containing protein n=1 Tax=Kribbella solani TaxID=236067 RepID=UPI0029A665E9|nr:trehalase family glycosidase [Kribbella solani]MDX2968992.1 trehalase family glycosidase [Kribbella solani]
MTNESTAAYDRLRDEVGRGWNTWDTRSVLTQVLLPDALGLSFGLKEYYRGTSLRAAQIGRRTEGAETVTLGPHAYDGSYTETTVSWAGITVRVQTAHAGDDLVALVTPAANQQQSALLTVGVSYLWNRAGVVVREGDRIRATGDRVVEVFTTGEHVDDPYCDIDGPYLAVDLSRVVGVSTGRVRSLTEIAAIVASAAADLGAASSEPPAQHHETAKQDEIAQHHEIVRDAISWNTIYEPAKARVITTVSRLWNVGKRGGYALFCWDAFFNALLAAPNSKPIAYLNVVEMLRARTPDGFVPNVEQGTGRKTYDGSQPPVGSLTVLELYRRFGDRWFLAETFEALLSWNRWWWRVRRDGELLCAGSTYFDAEYPSPQDIPRIHQHFGATCETGWDGHPVFDDVPFDQEKSLLAAHDVGMNSLYAADCEALADIADVLGETAVAAELRERRQTVVRAMETLWDEQSGIYRSRRTDTGLVTERLSTMSFYPLLAGVGTGERAGRMLSEHLLTDDGFGGEWILPTSPRHEPIQLKDTSYWELRAWPPVNFLVYLGLLRAGEKDAASWLAEGSSRLVLKEWNEHRHIHENYSSVHGAACDKPNSEPFQTWGALLSLIVLMERGEVTLFDDERWRG